MNSVSGGPIETLDNVGKNVSEGLQQFLVGPQPIGAITMRTFSIHRLPPKYSLKFCPDEPVFTLGSWKGARSNYPLISKSTLLLHEMIRRTQSEHFQCLPGIENSWEMIITDHQNTTKKLYWPWKYSALASPLCFSEGVGKNSHCHFSFSWEI